MIDAKHLKAHRTAASLIEKGFLRGALGEPRAARNPKLHAVCDGQGRPIVLLLTEGRMTDHKGAAIPPALPAARELPDDRGYDSNWFRAGLIARGIASTRSRKTTVAHDRTLYRQRHRVEHMFGRPNDWRRIATRCDRCAHTIFSAICLTATVTFWLPQ